MNNSPRITAKNTAFKKILQAMEEPILNASLKFFKLNEEERTKLLKQLEPLVKKIKAERLKPNEIPADFTERLGISKNDESKLLKAINTFVSSLNLSLGNTHNANFNKKELKKSIIKAVDDADFGKEMATRILKQTVFQKFNSESDECQQECLRIFAIDIALAVVIFAVTLLFCIIIGIPVFGISTGPCVFAALALLLSGIAAATAKYQNCLANCQRPSVD